jgi:pimeloyl-ACP methyl ester carboxylesterase
MAVERPRHLRSDLRDGQEKPRPGGASNYDHRMLRPILTLIAVAAAGGGLPSQALEDQRKLAREYLAADDDKARQLEIELQKVPPLSKEEAKSWTEWVRKTWKSLGAPLDAKGTNYFYDKETKRGKYIVAGGDNRKGLVIGMHGGGVGQADCGGAASSWRSAVQNAGMIGIFPEAIEATEAAWGDDVTVKFVLDLLAAAHRTFTFDPDRVYVVGHSMGGYGAWTWGGRFSDRLAGVVSFAGGPTPVLDGDKVTAIQPGVLPNFHNVPIWVYHSADDPQVPIAPTRFAVEGLRALKAAHPAGFPFRYEEEAKQGHAFPPKGPTPAIAWITQQKRDPAPRKILWEAFYEQPDQRYWLACERPVPGRTLEATWNGKGAFDVNGDADQKTIAVLLHDGMWDLDQPVTVTFAGKPLFAGVAKRSLAVLLRSARRRCDPKLLFTATAP